MIVKVDSIKMVLDFLNNMLGINKKSNRLNFGSYKPF